MTIIYKFSDPVINIVYTDTIFIMVNYIMYVNVDLIGKLPGAYV